MVNITSMVMGSGQPKRVSRTPAFPCSGTMKPYGLYPIFAHPVLPGETLQSASIKLRTLSMPLNHPLGGAWKEGWLVYVKLTDIDKDLGQSFVSDDVASTGYEASSDGARYFHKTGDVRWIRLAVERIHSAYFVHETEPPEARRFIDGVPLIKINNRSWYENMAFEESDVTVPTGDASDLYKHLQEYAILQQMQLTEMTYEKYLEQYGGQIPRATQGDPEILRFSRSWTLPTNIVEPTNGTPTSAWVWSDEVKLEKAKRFEEPGFLVYLEAIRPKLYNRRVETSFIGQLWGFSDWFPIYNLNDPTAGIKTLSTDWSGFGAGFRSDSGAVNMLYDHRDLLTNGEQFVNNWTAQPYRLPIAQGMSADDADSPEDLRGEYPLITDIDALFADGANDVCYYDGIAFLNISGHVAQQTPVR
jgi:hypothetical protein